MDKANTPGPDQPEWDDREYVYVLPFTEVESVGGPYQDLAFCAGYQVGEINGKLSSRTLVAGTFLIFPQLIKQVDLIAMRHNYTTEILHNDDTWCQIGITRVGE